MLWGREAQLGNSSGVGLEVHPRVDDDGAASTGVYLHTPCSSTREAVQDRTLYMLHKTRSTRQADILTSPMVCISIVKKVLQTSWNHSFMPAKPV
jgi:hypothetical protein